MRRLVIVLGIGIVAGGVCWLFQSIHAIAGTDVLWSVDAARALLAGQRLYTAQPDPLNIPYPLTAVVIALPLTVLPKALVGPLFMAASSALLAWALVRERQWWRLLLFMSPPFVMALQLVQWSPFLCAVALLPALAPLALCKPTIGAALMLPQLTWRRAAACVAFGGLTLLIDSTWPLRWYPQTRAYYGFSPLLLLPFGPLLALVLLRWRELNARWLFLLACVPQQVFFYDALPLWLVPASRRQILLLTLTGWSTFFGVVSFADFRWGPLSMVLGCYLPAAGIVLFQGRTPNQRIAPAQPEVALPTSAS